MKDRSLRTRERDPFGELIQMQDRTDRLLREGFGATNMMRLEMPAIDVYEQDNKLIVEASLPNFNEKDIEVNLSDGGLEIKAEHSTESDTKERKYILHETTSSAFYRYINLPAGANVDDAKAIFENGMLRIDVPMEKKSQSKTLQINPDTPNTK